MGKARKVIKNPLPCECTGSWSTAHVAQPWGLSCALRLQPAKNSQFLNNFSPLVEGRDAALHG